MAMNVYLNVIVIFFFSFGQTGTRFAWP